MDNIQLQLVLQKAYNKSFLDKIEYLIEQEKEYKRSEFFKLARIPLLTLYEKYDQYTRSREFIADQFNEFVDAIDSENVVKKLGDILEEIEKEKRIVDILNDLVENFNVEKVSEYATQIQEAAKSLKE
jgi:type I restriction-modification system DNA methylase subunit